LLVVSLALGPMFGPGLGLPQWVVDLSPFTHLPKAPANPVVMSQLVTLAVLCVGCVLVGSAGLRRRDLALPV
jgi:ABC-2 type transport system permease protein